MPKFIVLYRIESIMCFSDDPFGFVCHAADEYDAEEMCQEAYPECDVVWVSSANTVEEAWLEFWNSEEVLDKEEMVA
jgi:hypothetical protein